MVFWTLLLCLQHVTLKKSFLLLIQEHNSLTSWIFKCCCKKRELFLSLLFFKQLVSFEQLETTLDFFEKQFEKKNSIRAKLRFLTKTRFCVKILRKRKTKEVLKFWNESSQVWPCQLAWQVEGCGQIIAVVVVVVLCCKLRWSSFVTFWLLLKVGKKYFVLSLYFESWTFFNNSFGS